MKRDQLIYTVIWQLTEFGLGIKTSDDRYAGNFLASRDFELPELKLLVDAVQSSRFITVKKSEDPPWGQAPTWSNERQIRKISH